MMFGEPFCNLQCIHYSQYSVCIVHNARTRTVGVHYSQYLECGVSDICSVVGNLK